MSRTNETRFLEWHETCKCKCRLDAIVCNNKQYWNKNKCRCKCIYKLTLKIKLIIFTMIKLILKMMMQSC